MQIIHACGHLFVILEFGSVTHQQFFFSPYYLANSQTHKQTLLIMRFNHLNDHGALYSFTSVQLPVIFLAFSHFLWSPKVYV